MTSIPFSAFRFDLALVAIVIVALYYSAVMGVKRRIPWPLALGIQIFAIFAAVLVFTDRDFGFSIPAIVLACAFLDLIFMIVERLPTKIN